MIECSVLDCPNNSTNTAGTDIQFLPFPKRDDQCKKWMEACGKIVPNVKTARVCSEHFSYVNSKCESEKFEEAMLSEGCSSFLIESSQSNSAMLVSSESEDDDDSDELQNPEDADSTLFYPANTIEDEEDAHVEKLVSKMEDTILHLEKENRCLLKYLHDLEQINSRVLLELNTLKNKIGC